MLQEEVPEEEITEHNNNNNNIKDICEDAVPEFNEYESEFNENVRAANSESLGVTLEMEKENIENGRSPEQKNTYLQDTKSFQDITIPSIIKSESNIDQLTHSPKMRSKVNDNQTEMRLRPDVKDSESQTKQSRPNSFRCRGCGVEHSRDTLERKRDKIASNKEKFEESVRDNEYEDEDEDEERPRFNSERFRKKKKKAATLDNTQLVSVHHYIGKLVQVCRLCTNNCKLQCSWYLSILACSSQYSRSGRELKLLDINRVHANIYIKVTDIL